MRTATKALTIVNHAERFVSTGLLGRLQIQLPSTRFLLALSGLSRYLLLWKMSTELSRPSAESLTFNMYVTLLSHVMPIAA